MRLLAITHAMGTTGAAVCLVDFLQFLAQQGHGVDLLHQGPHRHQAALAAAGIQQVERATVSPYDVVLINTVIDAHWATLIHPRRPCVLWSHEGVMGLPAAEDFATWQQAVARMARVVCQTTWQANVALQPLMHAVPPERLYIVPNGLPAWARAPVARTPHAQPVIAWAGSLYPRKCPGDLARAALLLANLGAQVHFTGSTDHLDLLPEADRHLLLSQPRVFRLLGEADRATTLGRIASADVFCLPSADESFPLTVLEAAAQSVPMALSDLPCYAGIWQHGVNALLSAPGDVPALARNLRTLLTDRPLALRLGQAGRDTALRYPQETQHAALTQVLLDAQRDPPPPTPPEIHRNVP